MSWSNNSFFNPNSLYGASRSYYDTPLVKFAEDEQTSGPFMRWVQQQGGGGFGRRDLFAQSLRNRTLQGWDAARSINPNLAYRDYLSGLGENFVGNIWSSLTPEQRGETPARFSSPVRWMSRG